jgi:hypothetical protein
MVKNVMLPLFLLFRTVDLLKKLDSLKYNEVRLEHKQILNALEAKIWKLECKKPYLSILLDADHTNDYPECIECVKIRLLTGEIDLEYDPDSDLPF